MNTIEERIKKVVSKQLKIKQEQILNTHSFVKDLRADSLDIVELFMALEEEFNIEIPDEEAEKIITVQAAINYVKTIIS
ncbi:MAG: acyl carrier protein [Candidatus Dasytiphilus stammeri]